MNIIEILEAFAEELENPDNIALRNAEEDDTLDIVATACLQAATIFREAASKTMFSVPCEKCKGKGHIEAKNESSGKKMKDLPCGECHGSGNVKVKKESSVITPERLDEMAVLAAEFDASGDELLQKQASVLDEILLTIAAPKGVKTMSTRYEDDKIEALKKEYAKTKESLDENIKVSDARKAIEKSESYKEYRPLEAALNTRYCPDHPGVPTARVGEHEFQCSLDEKIFNFETGYRTSKGNSVPGGRVEDQSQPIHNEPHSLFDTRESRLASGEK